MANRIHQLSLSEKNLGKKIKATFSQERELYDDKGRRVAGRIFTASSAEQRDFEVYVVGLRNSQQFVGRKEVILTNPVVRINAKRNNVGNTRSLDMVVYADRLEVMGDE